MAYNHFSGLVVPCSLLAAGAARGQTGEARPGYRDPAIPTARRVDDLLARMTLEEKLAQMLCPRKGKQQITDARGRFDPARTPERLRVGIGRIERPSDGRRRTQHGRKRTLIRRLDRAGLPQ